MTEPIEKITDETVIIVNLGIVDDGLPVKNILINEMDEPYRTMLLTSAEKDVRVKELEEKLKEALETLEELKWCYHNADSGKRWVEAVRDCVDLVEKLKAE